MTINTAALRDRKAFETRSPNEDFSLLQACADRIDELEAALKRALGKEAS